MANTDYTQKAIKAGKQAAPPKEPPTTVRVRAREDGFYGNLIRRGPREGREGEVFDMDVKDMRQFPPPVAKKGDFLKWSEKAAKGGEVIGGPVADDATIVDTPKGKFELPSWTELMDDDADLTPTDRVEPNTSGHQTTFRETGNTVL